MQYPRSQYLGAMDFSPRAVVDDFQRLAGKVVPWLPDFTDGERVRLRQELSILESLIEHMTGRAEVQRAILGPVRRPHPLAPHAPPIYPDVPSFADGTRWRFRGRSRKAVQ